MKYSIDAYSQAKTHAVVDIRNTQVLIGTSAESGGQLPNPVELLLTSLAACILKNVERLSVLQNFEYSKASIEVSSIRVTSPTRLEDIEYQLTIYSDEKLNIGLLRRNIEEHGTIYNTIKKSVNISGAIELLDGNV